MVRSSQQDGAEVSSSTTQGSPRTPSERNSARPDCSVIIPLHRDGPAFRACLEGCRSLDYPSFELIVVSDVEVSLPKSVRLVVSRSQYDTGPGEKRDLGMHQ